MTRVGFVALAVAPAVEFDVAVPQTQLNPDQLRAAERAGYGERDMASLAHYMRGLA